jgi:hypothetical protein
VTNGSGRAWQVLYDLPSWQVTQCLAGALTAFQDCSWPLDLLRLAGRDDEH